MTRCEVCGRHDDHYPTCTASAETDLDRYRAALQIIALGQHPNPQAYAILTLDPPDA